MAICPKCHEKGEFFNECPKCHRHYVEEEDLKKSREDELLGALIGGQYVPLALIGEGGMGRIYRAKAKYTGKTVALKILKSEYMDDEILKDRFFREAEVVAALDHPNIVKLYGCAPEPQFNTIFMAMELLTGMSMFDKLKGKVPPLHTVVEWFVETSAALGEAHRHGIFHRDLKPENVFITKGNDEKEHAKVLDFGFARLQGAAKKLTQAGVAFGTPHYMSPEQAMALPDITGAVDIYALGIMLFQVISGALPFNSANNSPVEVMHAQVNDPTPECIPRFEYGDSVPEDLIQCIYKCMEKEPKNRYQNGDELHKELLRILNSINNVDQRSLPTLTNIAPSAPVQKKTNSRNQTEAIKKSSGGMSTTNKILIALLVTLIVATGVVLFILLR